VYIITTWSWSQACSSSQRWSKVWSGCSGLIRLNFVTIRTVSKTLKPGRDSFIFGNLLIRYCTSWQHQGVYPVFPAFQDGCKETAGKKGSEQEHRYKMEAECQEFILLSVNLWTQVRSQCFSAKAVSKYLLQFQFLKIPCIFLYTNFRIGLLIARKNFQIQFWDFFFYIKPTDQLDKYWYLNNIESYHPWT
jgi:hypothetical protein